MEDEKMPEEIYAVDGQHWWEYATQHYRTTKYIRHDLNQSTLTELQAARAVIDKCTKIVIDLAREDEAEDVFELVEWAEEALADIEAFKKEFPTT